MDNLRSMVLQINVIYYLEKAIELARKEGKSKEYISKIEKILKEEKQILDN